MACPVAAAKPDANDSGLIAKPFYASCIGRRFRRLPHTIAVGSHHQYPDPDAE